MAVGAMLIARRSASIHDPLRMYALVEFAIGIGGLLFHAAFQFVTRIAYDSLFPAIGYGTSLVVVQWTLAAALILPQSILLGATFPLLTGGALRLSAADPGHTLGLLYFANSIGAAAGVLLAGFFLIGAVGLDGTVRVAAAINIIVGAAVLVAARRHRRSALAARDTDVPEAALAGHTGARLLWRIMLAVSFGTAFSSFLYSSGFALHDRNRRLVSR
jgi:hypothetical protein